MEYSVIIRTVGKAGKKYQQLLDAIATLDPQPKEVIVVLPEGYEKPSEQLGRETYYFSPKGMVSQRLHGIRMCKTPYALIVDDDISFDSDFVRKLHEPIEKRLCELSSGPLYSFLPEKGIKAFASMICGAALPTLFHKDRYVSVLRTAGYSYNRNLQLNKGYYEAQSLAWTCFYADVAALKRIGLEEEKWLDAGGYAAYDDQTMFYKAWLRGIKTIVVPDALYIHQDAKTSSTGNKSLVLHCLAKNRLVFWHRFIYCMERTMTGRIWAGMCISYRVVWAIAWAYADRVLRRYTQEDLNAVLSGYREGYKYINSQEYKRLPPI